MQEQERVFISFMEMSHPLLQEMPISFRTLWFHGYKSSRSQDTLFLQMERIYKNPMTQKGDFLDLLTFEIANMEALLEWEEDFPLKSFVASDPYYIFYDGIDDTKRGLFSVGNLDKKTMSFIPELEIFITPTEQGIIVDFQEGEIPDLWQTVIKK